MGGMMEPLRNGVIFSDQGCEFNNCTISGSLIFAVEGVPSNAPLWRRLWAALRKETTARPILIKDCTISGIIESQEEKAYRERQRGNGNP